MRRILAATILAAAAFAPGAASASHHGDCGGVVDIDCTGHFCRLDCFSSHCAVWLDPLHDPHSAQCIL